jgi:flagellar biosynthesis/type III secretory pathway protein FliH
VLRTIERSHLSPQEAFLLKEEAGWESAKREARGEGKEEGLREGKEEGLREGEAKGKAEGLRAAVLDLCEAFGLETTDEQRAQLEAMGVNELEALRAALKQHRRWPA